jgi:hypothetical protein
MEQEVSELVRLKRRIADVQRSIEEAERTDYRPWGSSEQGKMLSLLKATLKSLEARKAVLERMHR